MAHQCSTIFESCTANLMFSQEIFGLGCISYDFGREVTYFMSGIEIKLFTVLVNTCCAPILELQLAGGRKYPWATWNREDHVALDTHGLYAFL